MERALANLVDNALRHAPVGTRVRLATGRRDGWAWLAVVDEGPGVAAEHRERLFDRFYRLDKARSRADGGSGLGLAIVREIAEAHRGDVRLFLELGHGATFVVWLPLIGARSTAPSSCPL